MVAQKRYELFLRSRSAFEYDDRSRPQGADIRYENMNLPLLLWCC